MGRNGFSVDLKNDPDQIIALSAGDLTMRSLFAFRALRIVKKFGDEGFCT